MSLLKNISTLCLTGLLLTTAIPVANAVVGGTPANGYLPNDLQAPWVGFLVPQGADLPIQAGGCGATLIAPQWALTSTYCIADTSQLGSVDPDRLGLYTIDERKVDFLIGSYQLSDPALRRVRVDYAVPAPDFLTFYSIVAQNKHTIALLRLESPITDIEPVTLANSVDGFDYTDGVSGIQLGWGYTDWEEFSPHNPDDRWYADELQMIERQYTPFIYPDGPAFPNWLRGTSVGGSPCKGDDGGPVLMRSPANGQWVQTAIHRGNVTCLDNSYEGDTIPNSKRTIAVAGFRDWIDSVIDETPLAKPVVDGDLDVTCFEVLCMINAAGLTVDGREPGQVSITVTKSDEDTVHVYDPTFTTASFRTEPGIDYDVTAVIMDKEPGNEYRQVTLRPEDYPKTVFGEVNPTLNIECEGLTCTFQARDVRGTANKHWIIDGEKNWSWAKHTFEAPGTYPVAFQALTYDGDFLIRETNLLVYDDGRPATFMETATGTLGERDRAFPMGQVGRYVQAGEYIIMTLYTEYDGVLMTLQRYEGPDLGWKTVADADERATRRGRTHLRYNTTKEGHYRIRLWSKDVGGTWSTSELVNDVKTVLKD